MREEIFYQFPRENSLRIKVGAPSVSLSQKQSMYSLNKVIDTPSRENCGTNSSFMIEDEPLNFNNIFNDQADCLNTSQDITNEENQGKIQLSSTNCIRKMTVNTSDQFTSWKQVDYENFKIKYRSVKNNEAKNINFKLTNKIMNNFTVKKIKK